MKGFISIILISLIVWAILTKSYQIKRRILIFYLILTSCGAFVHISKFGFTKGVGGIIGTLLPIGIVVYFLNKIRNPTTQTFKTDIITSSNSNSSNNQSFAKSLLRLGEIGETSKVCGQAYNLPYLSDALHKEKLSFILNQRAGALIGLNIKGCLINADTIPIILGSCHNDLPFMVIQIMFYETTQFRNNILTSASTTNDVIEVVYEVINEIAPHSILLSLNDLRVKSFHFLKTMYQVL
jgi:hypothetical protein